MDIMEIVKDKIDQIAVKIKKDSKLADKFQKDPIGTVESLLDVDLPNEQLEPLVEGIKAKLDLDRLGDMLGGLGKLFGK